MNYKVEGLTVDPRTASSLTLNSGVVKDKLLEALMNRLIKIILIGSWEIWD